MKKILVCLLFTIRGLMACLCFLRLCLALCLIFPQFMRAGDATPLPDSEAVEKAVLAEDWKAVAGQLTGVETNGASATYRLIKGHACLALNENNESFSLFLSTTSQVDRAAYVEWASMFVARNPETAIAYYFKGDALARETNGNDAIGSFNKALAINPKHALCLNARGVVFAQQSKVALAKKDFLEAIACSGGDLSDAHGNAGYLWIQRKDGAKGALEAFKNALQQSPRSALALHGKGCIELVTGDQSAAVDDLVSARTNSGSALPLLIENEVRYAIQTTGNSSTNLLADLQEPGTSVRMDVGAKKAGPIGVSGNASLEVSHKAANGAAGAYAHVKIQDGNWPFLPIYGLAYGLGDSTEPNRKQ